MSPLFAPFSNTIVAPKIVAFQKLLKMKMTHLARTLKVISLMTSVNERQDILFFRAIFNQFAGILMVPVNQ